MKYIQKSVTETSTQCKSLQQTQSLKFYFSSFEFAMVQNDSQIVSSIWNGYATKWRYICFAVNNHWEDSYAIAILSMFDRLRNWIRYLFNVNNQSMNLFSQKIHRWRSNGYFEIRRPTMKLWRYIDDNSIHLAAFGAWSILSAEIKW